MKNDVRSLNQAISELFELANRYPSPHNAQPIQVKQLDEKTFELYFRKDRGLQAAEISYLFSYVTMGVFISHLSLCAEALGHTLQYETHLPALTLMHGEGSVGFATCRLEYWTKDPDSELRRTLFFRQTSRKKYSEGLAEKVSDQIIADADRQGMQLVKLGRKDSHQAIWLNQRAVFDDMFDDAVRNELDHWLRYNKKDKETKKDGLAYDCMELNGAVIKFIVDHHAVLRWPGVSQLLKYYYLRTMSDSSDVFYLLAPFSTEQEAFDVGLVVMQTWETIAAAGCYLHPYGTIMSNAAAHRDFLSLAGIAHEDKHQNFLTFIYRAGKSEMPTASVRIAISGHLLKG